MSGESILDQYMPKDPRRRRGDDDEGGGRAAAYVAMLDIELPTGNRVAYPYASLVKIEFDPSRSILLRYATEDVELTGHRLEPLYKGLTQHRVPYLKVMGGNEQFANVADGGPVVTGYRCGPAGE